MPPADPPKNSRIFVRVADISLLTKWQEFVDRHPAAGCMHHAAWYHILRDAFWVEPFFLIAEDSIGNARGVLPLYKSTSFLSGQHLSSLEGGVLVDGEDVSDALLSFALKLSGDVGAKFLQVRGDIKSAKPSKIVRTVHTLIDTGRSEQAIWAALRKKTRWAVRSAEKHSIRVTIDPALEQIRMFYGLYAEHMRSLGTPVVGFEMFDSLRARMGSDRLRLYLVTDHDEAIGGMLCILNKHRWTDQYAIVRPSKSTPYANYLLYWHVIKDTVANGIPLLDLGRSTPSSSVHQFKRKWGGFDADVPYCFFTSRDNGNVSAKLEELKGSKGLAQKIWSQLPLFFCNYFGPLLRKQLPFI